MKRHIIAILTLALAGVVSAQGLLNRNLNRIGGRPNTAAATPAAAALTGPQKPSDPGASKVDAGGRSIEFNGAALDIVLMVYGNLVGKTVLKDPSCPASSITLQPKQGQDLTDEDKILAIETVLEMNGVHLEPYGEKFVRAITRGNARKDGIPLILDPEAELGETSKVVSMMLSFQNVALDEAQKALEGLKSDKGVLNVYERTSSILVTDTEMNLNRMREIAKKIDVPTPVTENVFVRQVKYAAAADIKTALEAIVQESQKELEKQGKQANSAQQRPAFQPFQPGSRLLGRNNNPQPQPTVNESLVTSVSDADRGMIRGKVLILADERSNKLIIVTAKPNMDFFDKVIEQLDVETTPDIAVKVYRLKYADAEDVSDMINDLIGNASSSKNSSRGNQNQNAKNGTGGNVSRTAAPTAPTVNKSVNQRTGETKTGELSKENTTVLADKRINGLVVMTNKDLVPTLEQIIESMDIKLSQVLIETVIIEVTLGDDLKTGIDWVRNRREDQSRRIATYSYTDPNSGKTTYRDFNYTDGNTTYVDEYDRGWDIVPDSLRTVTGLNKNSSEGGGSFWNGSAGYLSALAGGSSGGSAAAAIAAGVATNMFGSSFNYIFKSDKLNLSAIIQASKNDSRTKYIASPIVMTVDNKEATIDATESRKFFSGYETSSSYSTYMRTPKYDSKDIGIKIKVTPKINPNGTVMLEIEEEYSQVREGGQSILVGEGSQTASIDTALERKMSADALLENMQTVILCGLTESYKTESESGIPILKDIPWIGKWLFGSVSQTDSRKELLIFMTPYVLDDGDAAQAEALRRKKALSDSRPWEDNGWSASPLADPVSKKEQIRRLKDEAKTQDEERKTKLAIEKWKVERVKQLKEMSKEERDLWLEIHKEELSDEAERDDLEAKMEKTGDEAEQEALRKLAASIREKKLAEAEKEIKAADEQMASENERGKLDAEKKAKESETEMK